MGRLSANEKKVVVLSSIGGALEFYDFLIFVYVANTIGDVFFSTASTTLAMLASLTVFAISYFIRPLGGMILSHFGDTVGRKSTFVISILMMAIPTAMIGLIPGYDTIGVLAPILLILCRLTQGLAVGGEIPGAIVYVMEHVREPNKNFAIAVIFVGLSLGLLTAQTVIDTLQHVLSEQQFTQWGWRLPFILGGLLGIVGMALRSKLHETPEFEANKAASNIPMALLIKQYKLPVLKGICLYSVNAVVVYCLYIYLPSYLKQANLWQDSSSLFSSLHFLNILFFTTMVYIMGLLSNRIQAKYLLLFGAGGLATSSIFIYHLISHEQIVDLLAAMFIYSIFTAAITAASPYIIANLFPTEVRFTGMANSYNMAYALFGGTTPLIITLLLTNTGNPIMPAFYLTAVAILAILSLAFIKKINYGLSHC